ncbi:MULTISPECIES: helix-turn-helix transcriptional regulator [Serratia]|uniref:helix-turn-helix transcriptional regulator n=1 Tax=Serratia TaxID=613 RepID=UPI0003AE9F01|nr:YafY family protein [Serratia fonticola]ERK15707.1 Transcriptional regulator, DeoR family [Serratia fonticola AU-AP2C]MBP1015622.1 YafY family transcriptional regulator [Serratia fonticola]NYA41820.1 YafY family transcriptional regulator [Serratia fonticola]PAA98244.1 YafY family transcriptional regulator [Serratia fonticola]RDL27593.1 putative DNA-binding transcriptional regulator YafY [Serratia fonticola]
MSRTQRLLDLMQILRRHRYPVAGHSLAEELGISMRTLYRDIATLQQQGADIVGEVGIGYVLRPGFMLPPLMFSQTEIEALVLGMRWVERRGDSQLAGAATNALAKIAAVLPAELREELDANTLLIGPVPTAYVADETLVTIREAIRLERKIKVEYRDYAGNGSERILWPFAMGYFEQVQILMAWCELRGSIRHFRLDRIGHLTPLELRYPRGRRALMKQWRESEGIAQ